MTASLKEVLDIFSKITFVLGISNPSTWGKLCRIFIILNTFVYFVSVVWTFTQLDTETNIILKFQYGMGLGPDLGLCVSFFYMMKFSSEFKALLVWCDSLHGQYGDSSFGNAAYQSIKLFKAISFYCPTIICATTIFQVIVVSTVEGRLVPPVPLHLPFLLPTSVWSQMLVFCGQIVFFITVVYIFPLLLGTVTVVIFHFMKAYETMEVLLASISINDSRSAVNAKLKQFLRLHYDVLNQQELLLDLMFYMILLLDGITFSLLLYVWITIFFNPSQALMALNSIIFALFYYLMTWLNEKLADAHENLRTTLYNISWYELSNDFKMAQLHIMRIVDRPKLLTAGPFGVISYEKLSNMLKQVYSYGIVINGFLNPQ